MPDISSPGPPREHAFEQMSRASGTASFGLPPPRALPQRTGFLARRWRLLLALSLLGVAGFSLLREQLTIATEYAVITARTLPIRAPISGEVTYLAGEPGTELPALLAFARIENRRLDRGRLLDAIQGRDRAADELDTVIGHLAALEDLAADLRSRGAEHREMTVLHLDSLLREALELRAAAEARAHRAAQEAQRAAELARGGHASQAARERGEAELETARREAEAQAMRIIAVQRQMEAARRGIFIQPGQLGASYAEQRLDELALRKADLAGQVSQRQAALNRATFRLAEEREQHEAQRSAIITPPKEALLWRLQVHPGQQVVQNEVMAELLDCRSAFLLAAVPQSALPGLPPGTTARLRLAGERETHLGLVVGGQDAGPAREADSLAAQPTRPPGATALVRIALPAFPSGMPCPVGRVGRVVFEGRGLPRPW